MRRIFILLSILYTVSGQNDGDLESIIKKLFGEPSQNETNPQGTGGFVQNTPTPAPVIEGNGQNPGAAGSGISLNQNPTVAGEKDLSCTTESGAVGECVHYYLCNSNETIISDGTGIIDIRIRDGECESYLDTCCQSGDTRAPDNPITPIPPKKEDERKGCGWSNPNGVGFRIKGAQDNEASFGEFPWMVALLKVEPVDSNDLNSQKFNVYLGGGSLIHPSVVLTTAHYVAAGSDFRVRAGEWDTQSQSEIYPYQDRVVTEVIIHKDYNKGNLFYDIAVLILSQPMDMAPNVGLACLPNAGERAQSGTRCFASGWGKNIFGKMGLYQVILKKVDLPVVNRNTCEAQLQKTRLGHNFKLHSSFMCAGGEDGKDTCRGDGGSPLVCPIEFETDRFQQSGMVAWGIGCGEDKVPGVYVDVANLRNWIDEQVTGKGFDPKVYSLY